MNSIGELRGEVKSIKLTLENKTNQNIKLIAEGHLDISRKLDDAFIIHQYKSKTFRIYSFQGYNYPCLLLSR